MMFWYGDGMSGWGYALMTVSMVVFWALVIGGIVVLIRYAGVSQRPSNNPIGRPNPEQVLAERFARGEIDDDGWMTLRSGFGPVGVRQPLWKRSPL